MASERLNPPQQERSRKTRAALLNAAIDCLVELGYADTTVTEVAKRAGVSRGAQLHHFPTKAELLTAAAGHLLDRRVADYRKAFANLEPGADRVESAIDLLWTMYQGPAFVAWAELWMAARTDEGLRTAVVEMDHRFWEQSLEISREIFPDVAQHDPGFLLGIEFTYQFMDGVALRNMVPNGSDRKPSEMIDAFKVIAALMMAPQPEQEALQ